MIMTETGVTTEKTTTMMMMRLQTSTMTVLEGSLDHMIHQMMWMATDASTQRTMMTTETVGSILKKSIAQCDPLNYYDVPSDFDLGS